MGGASRGRQILIYVGKCFRVFLNERGWKTFISAAIITLIISNVTSSDMFIGYGETKNGAFALVCACIWIGIFNSIQSVCKERDIIKREHRSGLYMSSYVFAHMLFETVLCLAESVIVTVIICLFKLNNLPDSGIFLPIYLEFQISFFLIIISADALGLMVSSIVKTTATAMTVMPFILIIQLVMSGNIFTLEGTVNTTIAKLTVAKWGINALAVSSELNGMATPLRKIAEQNYNIENLLVAWGMMFIFTWVYMICAIISLQFIDKDKR